MSCLTKDQIFKSEDLKPLKVSVPEWGGDVYVRMMTAKDRDAFESQIVTARENGEKVENMRALLAVLCVVDDKGARIFGDDDIEAVGKKSASALDRIFTAARDLNGMTAKDVEDLEKN